MNHHVPCSIGAESLPIRNGLRAQRGLSLITATPDRPIRLRWDHVPTYVTALRVSVGLDDRTFPTCLLHAFLPESGRLIGTFDIRFSGVFKIQSLDLAQADAAAIASEGIELRLEGADYLHLIGANDPATPVLRPHLLTAGGDAFDNFCSLTQTPAVRHPFGWLAGCVMDGQAELGFDDALRAIFLDDFFPDSLMFNEGPGSTPRDGEYYGIEALLPVAQLVRLRPKHPAIDQAIEFIRSKTRDDGIVIDHAITTEGCYTIAWPLAAVDRARGQTAHQDVAIRQCVLRSRVNVVGDVVYQCVTPDGERKLPNWCRGVGWFLLGSLRTMEAYGHADPELLAAVRHVAGIVRKHQRDDGVWGNFIDEPNSRTDCSGSAGIAAALAIGVRAELLDASYRDIAERALGGLKRHLTPDGLLTTCAQENKGGETLQRSDYRVISQMGMGLMAQLAGVLSSRPVSR